MASSIRAVPGTTEPTSSLPYKRRVRSTEASRSTVPTSATCSSRIRSTLSLPTELTVSAWARLEPVDATSRLIVAKWKLGGGFSFWLGKFDATTLAFSLDGGGASTVNAPVNLVDDGAWHHLAGVAESGGAMRFFIDGVEMTPAAFTSPIETGTSELRIGRNPDVAAQEWDGGIDEVRVESVARSAEWVRADYLSMSDAFISYGGPEPSGFMRVKSGSYTGNGADDRPIFVGFQPDVVIVDTNESSNAPAYETILRTSTMIGDSSKTIDNTVPNAADQIQSLDSTGFTVGTSLTVNETGVEYHWDSPPDSPHFLRVRLFLFACFVFCRRCIKR